MKKDSIAFGSETIDYTVLFSERKTLGITVTPNMEIVVQAPKHTTEPIIQSKVRKKAAWILKQKDFFLSFHPKTPKRNYVSGETHLYLGRQYRLQVIDSNKNEVQYKGRHFELLTDDRTKGEQLMKQWYRERSKLKFAEFAEPWIQKFKLLGVEPTGIYLQDMPTRWGSCTPKGKIILNPELIKAPKACIEYVIVHELCHLIHRDHTQKFIALQTKMMPDWRRWKQKLETLLA